MGKRTSRRFTVYFEGNLDMSVDVEVDENDEFDIEDFIDEAIDKANDRRPTTICAQCSGFGQPYSITLPDDVEVYAVFDEDGEEVWSD